MLFILVCNLAVLVAAAGRVTPVGRAAEALHAPETEELKRFLSFYEN